ncbi:unnamed protein product, partial [Coccothraustes coccothraustes]
LAHHAYYQVQRLSKAVFSSFWFWRSTQHCIMKYDCDEGQRSGKGQEQRKHHPYSLSTHTVLS